MRGSMAGGCDEEAAGAPASVEKPLHKPLVPVICVVPGCTTDVSGGPHYLKRHKICQVHLKATEVSINGRAVRFCQQCGRFQPLADFKDNQRSCEAALQAHNARRRVKKDGQAGSTWSSDRRGRGAKRSLPAACATDDPSSSEDGATNAPRKSATARKSSSQRSAPSALQTSAGGSDSIEGSKGHDRPLSDGARTVEQGAWTSHASPDNSFGSPEGFEQQYNLEEGQLLHMLPDGSYQQGVTAGASRLGLQSGASGSTDAGYSAGCSALSGLLYHTPQDLGMGAQPALSQAQQMMSGPTLSCNPSTAFGGNITPPGTLEAWMLPQGVMQQQQAQLQQYWAPTGVAGSGLQEAMGQSVMLQQAMQEQQRLMMMSQPQLQHQPSMQMQVQHSMLLSQQQQQQPKQDPLQQKLQQLSGFGTGSTKNGKASAATESSGNTLFTGQDLSGASARTASVEPSATGPQACMPAGSQDKAADQPPATSAAAAAMLAKDPMFGLLPIQGANSSSSLSLLDGLDASAREPPAALAEVRGSATFDEDSLLEHALDVLLASGPDWQMDDVLLGPSAAAVRSGGTNSAPVPPATTSSPSSSNINGGNNLSGPLSVPSLPSASAGQFSAQQAACGMAAATAGLVSATDALRVGSPGKGPAAIVPAAAAAGGMLAAAGDGIGMPASIDDLLPPIHFSAGHAVAGMDLSAPVPAAAGVVDLAAGSFVSAGSGVFPAAAGCAQVGGMISTGSMFPGSAAASLFGPGAVPGGAAALGGGLQPTAGGAMPCALSAAPSMTGLGVGAGGLAAVGVSSALALTHTTGAMATQQHGGGFSQLDNVFTGLPGPSVQAMWQQQQQQQESLLLQQQLMMQQQQQAEYLLLQQQQQLQRRQQLMQLQQQINSTITYSQQMVRLSMKLHGTTPERLPVTTVLAMERLLVNNAADMEMILLQPSLRQGCIQFEFDIIVKCPLLSKQQEDGSSRPLPAHGGAGAGAAQQAAEGGAQQQPRGAAARAAAAAQEEASPSTSGPLPDFELGSGSKWYLGSETPAIVPALNNDSAMKAAEARLRAALPFHQLVEALLDLPLLDDEAAAAAGDAHDSDDPGSSSSGSDAYSDSASSAGSSSSAGATVRSCAQAIYAQVGDSLGIWRADSGLVQGWDTVLSPELTFGAGAVGASWRPAIRSCMPLVAAVAESSAANSPTAAAAAGQAHVLKPLPLRLELQAAPGSSSSAAGSSDSSKLELWCTRRGQFLPLATRVAPAGAAPAPLGSADLLDLQVVAGLLDSTPGLLLLQVEQQVQLQDADTTTPSTGQQGRLPAEAQELGCMSSLIPVLLCPSAAMAAECNVHLCMMRDAAQVAPKMLELGLVLDFWAMHQQLQQPQQLLDSSPRAAWQEALLNNRQYLKVIKSLGTRLLLTAVVSGMSATSAHLHAIMLVVRDLLAASPAQAAPAAPVVAASAAANAHAEAADAGDEQAEEPSSHSSVVLQKGGFSPAGAAGLKPVEEWVFEDVDCKGNAAGEQDCRSPSSSSSSNPGLVKQDGKAAAGPAGGVAGDAAEVHESGAQQSPYVIFRGATQMLAMLLVMYFLLEVLAAVYKGRSPAQQLLESLAQLKDLLGIMLVPLAMMCLGGALAVWQFGLNGGGAQAMERRRQQQQAASMTAADCPASKAAAGKAASLQEEGVAWT